jgi:uncharacterized membrane protein
MLEMIAGDPQGACGNPRRRQRRALNHAENRGGKISLKRFSLSMFCAESNSWQLPKIYLLSLLALIVFRVSNEIQPRNGLATSKTTLISGFRVRNHDANAF